MNSTGEIERVLAMRTWFVIGLGDNPARDAYWVSDVLQRLGRRIVPVHPRAEVVLGEQGFRTVAEAADAVGAPDVVDLFVNSSRAAEFVDQAIDVGAKAVWFQLGVHDAEAEERARSAGLTVITNRCPKIELLNR